MSSLYWDDFERRIYETVDCIKNHKEIPIRRVAVFITDMCNFRCKYCNVKFQKNQMALETFDEIVKKYGKSAIIHITGGEPSLVPWLYEYVEKTPGVRFHLNTNAFLTPPKNLKRLKISLDTHIEKDFDNLVQKEGAFKNVVNNIRESSKNVITSITCVLGKNTYKNAPEFMKWCRIQFPDVYAVFFSCYKGDSHDFKMTESEANDFFYNIKPELEKEMNKESYELLNETIEEKFRIFGNKRFPENKLGNKCYISLSELVFDPKGNEYKCSHLFRDKVMNNNSEICTSCVSGCNRRLVMFNQEVEKKLKEK